MIGLKFDPVGAFLPPPNRAQRRAVSQAKERRERAQRRSRARIERALSQYQKESS